MEIKVALVLANCFLSDQTPVQWSHYRGVTSHDYGLQESLNQCHTLHQCPGLCSSHPLVAGVPASTEAVGGQANRTRQVLGFSRIKLHLDKGVKISCLDARKENMITKM